MTQIETKENIIVETLMSNLQSEQKKNDELQNSLNELLCMYKSLLSKTVCKAMKKTADIQWNFSFNDLHDNKTLKGTFDKFEISVDSEIKTLNVSEVITKSFVLDDLSYSTSKEEFFPNVDVPADMPIVPPPLPVERDTVIENKDSELTKMSIYYRDVLKPTLMNVCDLADSRGLTEVWVTPTGIYEEGWGNPVSALPKMSMDSYDELIDIILDNGDFYDVDHNSDTDNIRIMKGGEKYEFYKKHY